MFNILFFLVSITSLFSTTQPFRVKQTTFLTKETKLGDIPDNICNECKYFITDEKKCKLFYTIDLVNGKEYEKASEVRKINSKCGVEGKYYKKNKFIFVKKMGDTFYENYPIIITCSYVILYFFILNYKYK